jgi:hypothetical protein
MDTIPETQPAQSTDVSASPITVSECETPDARNRRLQSAPADPHPPIDEPGYGHGV